MLFDLSNPRRKNVVRVVYGLLAVVFGGGFVLFGVGSETGGGGLFDGLFGDGSGGSTADQYEQQIEDTEKTLEEDPENLRALADLVTYRYLSGQAQLDVDEATGEVTGMPEEARGELEKAVDAWTQYLDAKPPRRTDLAAATNAVSSYRLLQDASGAGEAQELVAAQQPGVNAFVELANYRYFAQDFKGGDKAGEQALEEAKPADRKRTQKALDQLRKDAERYKKQLAKQSKGGEEGAGVENPFGGVNPEGGGLQPAAP